MTRPQRRWGAFSAILAIAVALVLGVMPVSASAANRQGLAVAQGGESGSFTDPVYCGEEGAPAKPNCLKPIKARVFNLGCAPDGGGAASMLFVNPNRKGGPEAPRTIQVYRAGELFFQDDDWISPGVSRLEYTGLGAYPTDPPTPAVFRIRVVKLGADEQVKIVFADKWLDFRKCPQGTPPPPPPVDLAAAA